LHIGVFAGAVALILASSSGTSGEALLEKGRYLVYAGGCISCHTEDDRGATPLAGGYALLSSFGTFYTPNITPDMETGIGAWTDDDFVRAFHEGTSPEGDAYYPAFPYTSYTGISREDLLAIKAYLFSLDPVVNEVPRHDLPFYLSSRLAARAWQLIYFKPGRFQPDKSRDDSWNRGAYLVRHLGHCGECHTPRGRLGARLVEKELEGNSEGPGGENIPGITASREKGIGTWSLRDIEYFLEIGMLPDGDFAGGSMARVIDDNTSHLTPEDRRAIAMYLTSLSGDNREK